MGSQSNSLAKLGEHLRRPPGAFIKQPWPWVCFAYCLALYAREITLVDGSLFNSYPFMFSDSFDYVFEGQALAARLQGFAIPEFPMLRNPGYVLLQCLSHLSPRPEYVLFFVTNTFVFFYLLTPYFLARAFRISNYILYTVGLLFLLNPSNDIFVYMLADAQAMSLMSLSAVFYLIHKKKGQPRYFYLAVTCGLFGALTQTYAAIPVLMYMGLESLVHAFRTKGSWVKRISWKTLMVMVLLLAVYGWIQYLWMARIEHRSTPASYSLLELSTRNWGFYLKTWGYLLLLYSPVVVLILANFRSVKNAIASDSRIWMTLSSVVVFATLAFLYLWRDFRFTFIYLPLLFLCTMLLLNSLRPTRSRILLHVAIVQLLFIGVFTGGSSLHKGIDKLRISPESTYAARLTRAQPLDRGNLQQACPSATLICEEATLQPRTSYQRTIFKAMVQLHSRLDQTAVQPATRSSAASLPPESPDNEGVSKKMKRLNID